MIRTIEWTKDGIQMIDQRVLPTLETYHTYRTVDEVAEAIRTMVIRGAPALGVAAAMGLALGVQNLRAGDDIDLAYESISRTIAETRPTARNLFWAIERMTAVFNTEKSRGLEQLKAAMRSEALKIHSEDIEINRKLGRFGQELLDRQARVLTHCNAGALATAGYGTALGVIRAAVEQGKQITVFADETRPFLQGARLTAWEMVKEGIPCTLITDNMAGHFMKAGQIDAVIVGADRIAANGDTANKIGTYSVALLAREHKIPFYVAAPLSTVDFSLADGRQIPIEERSAAEVVEVFGHRVAPEGVQVANPAFDVTPARLISAVITEAGVAYPPYGNSLAALGGKGGQI